MNMYPIMGYLDCQCNQNTRNYTPLIIVWLIPSWHAVYVFFHYLLPLRFYMQYMYIRVVRVKLKR